MKLDSEFLFKIMKQRDITLSDVSFSTGIELSELQKLFDGETIRGWQMFELMKFFNCKSTVIFKMEPSTIIQTSSLSPRRFV